MGGFETILIFLCLEFFLFRIIFLLIFIKNYIIHHCLITKPFAIVGVIMSLIQYVLIFYISSRAFGDFHVECVAIAVQLSRGDPRQKVVCLRRAFTEFQSS